MSIYPRDITQVKRLKLSVGLPRSHSHHLHYFCNDHFLVLLSSFTVYGSISKQYLFRFARFEYNVQGIILYALVCGLLLVLIIIILRFMYVYMDGCNAFIFDVVYYSIIWKYYNLFFHSSDYDHLGFQLLANINHVSMDILSSLWPMSPRVSLRSILQGRIAELFAAQTFYFSK